jgi:hypothetical protein
VSRLRRRPTYPLDSSPDILVEEWGRQPMCAAEWERLTQAPSAGVVIQPAPNATVRTPRPQLTSINSPETDRLAARHDSNRYQMLEKVVQPPHCSYHMLPPGCKIVDIFDQLGAELAATHSRPGSNRDETGAGMSQQRRKW